MCNYQAVLVVSQSAVAAVDVPCAGVRQLWWIHREMKVELLHMEF